MRIATICVALCGLATTPLRSETVDEVIEKHVAARGGRQAWEAVDALELRGSFTSFSKSFPFVWQLGRGHRMRFDSTMSGHPFSMASDGESYWMSNEFYEITWPVRMFPQDRIHQRQDNELATALFDYREDGSTAELLGPSEVDGTATIAIRLTRADGQEETWHLDPETYLELARDSEGSNFGDAAPRRTFYADFRPVGALLVPFLVESEFYTRHWVHEVSEVIVDPTLDAARFAFPLPPGMDRLATLAGEWQVRVEERPGPWAPWEESGRASRIEPLARGSLLEERFTAKDGTEVVRTLSYDQFRQVYRLTQLDDFSSHLDIQEGRFDDAGTLSVHNVGTGTTWRAFGSTFHGRSSLSGITGDGFVLEEERSRDGGESWFAFSRSTYSRSAPAAD